MRAAQLATFSHQPWQWGRVSRSKKFRHTPFVEKHVSTEYIERKEKKKAPQQEQELMN